MCRSSAACRPRGIGSRPSPSTRTAPCARRRAAPDARRRTPPRPGHLDETRDCRPGRARHLADVRRIGQIDALDAEVVDPDLRRQRTNRDAPDALRVLRHRLRPLPLQHFADQFDARRIGRAQPERDTTVAVHIRRSHRRGRALRTSGGNEDEDDGCGSRKAKAGQGEAICTQRKREMSTRQLNLYCQDRRSRGGRRRRHPSGIRACANSGQNSGAPHRRLRRAVEWADDSEDDSNDRRRRVRHGGVGAHDVADTPDRRADKGRDGMARAYAVGRPRPAWRVDHRGRVRRAVRAARAVRRAAVPDRPGVRDTHAGHPRPRRAGPRAGGRSVWPRAGRGRPDSALARIQHDVAAHLARHRSAGRPSSAAHADGRADSRAAVRQPARRGAVRLVRRVPASASAASSTAAAFPTR